jgi:hypothetical protein
MDDLYLVIKQAIMEAWDNVWTRTDVPVLWRQNDPVPRIDPITGGTNGTPYFFRNEVEFGREEVIGFGGGRGRNFRAQYGSVVIRSFTSILLGDEDEGLKLIADATEIYRSYRKQQDEWDLTFIGSGSGFDWGPTENGVWFMRGCLQVYEFRFPG